MPSELRRCDGANNSGQFVKQGLEITALDTQFYARRNTQRVYSSMCQMRNARQKWESKEYSAKAGTTIGLRSLKFHVANGIFAIGMPIVASHCKIIKCQALGKDLPRVR